MCSIKIVNKLAKSETKICDVLAVLPEKINLIKIQNVIYLCVVYIKIITIKLLKIMNRTKNHDFDY